jgi:hypothetical protein
MTPDNQVSPAIRILRGERDASARATHLEAATRKFLVTTNERKYMSTKTNFKRIALVAVAALGLGVLSSVPSSAAVLGTVTVTATATGTATKAKADSTTAGSFTVKYTGQAAADSMSITAALKSYPAGADKPGLLAYFGDTSTSISTVTPLPATTDSRTISTHSTGATQAVITPLAGFGYVSTTFLAQLDTQVARTVGSYVFTIIVTPFSGGAIDTNRIVMADLTITVAELAGESKVASAANSTAYLSAAGGGTADASVTGVATASTSPAGVLEVKLRNASGTSGVAARESVTVTTTAGTVGVVGGTFGRSVVLAYNSDDSLTVHVRPDGTAGTATISVSTPSVTFPSKTLVFYATAPTTMVAAALNSTLAVGQNLLALSVVAKDANGNPWAGTLYTYSGTLTTISDTGTSCSYVAANSRHECTLTGAAAGTAAITVRNTTAANSGLATSVASNAVTMTVSTSSAATVKLAFDKATYAPGEKATLLVSVLDSAGKPVPARAWTDLFATGGISLSTAAGNGSDTTTAVSFSTYSLASLALGTSTDPIKAYTLYMPASGGTLKATATGGSALPLAGQVEVSATATVTDSGAAALAAVTALATQVASLRTLITTLTNLVLKIQKKVKA